MKSIKNRILSQKEKIVIQSTSINKKKMCVVRLPIMRAYSSVLFFGRTEEKHVCDILSENFIIKPLKYNLTKIYIVILYISLRIEKIFCLNPLILIL